MGHLGACVSHTSSVLTEMSGLKRSLNSGFIPGRPNRGLGPKRSQSDRQFSEGFAIPIQPTALPPPQGGEASGLSTRSEEKPYSRGSGAIALAQASNPDACVAAILAEEYAETSKGPMASRMRKWEELAKQGGFEDPMALTPELIQTVMGALKLAGYRSAEQYLETAKSNFIRAGGEWTLLLRQAAKGAVRSCQRGAGGPKQAAGLPLLKVAELTEQPALVSGGPTWPGRSSLLASWWLLREIEASQARRGHITIDMWACKVTWRLPSSKTDWKALGAERSHKCCCEFTLAEACPYHAMVEHLKYVPMDPEAFIFVTEEGGQCSKSGWSGTFQEIATKLGLPIMSQNGLRLFTGHSARATGAMYMAATNVELWRIQMFGRWGSEAFLGYIRDAPISQLDDLAAESTAKLSIQMAKLELKDLLRQVESYKESLAGVIAVPDETMLRDCEATAEVFPPEHDEMELPAPTMVRNRMTGGKVHITFDRDNEHHPRERRTKCAWHFARNSTDYEFVEQCEDSLKCRRCFPEMKHAKRSSSSTSSSSSSS